MLDWTGYLALDAVFVDLTGWLDGFPLCIDCPSTMQDGTDRRYAVAPAALGPFS